MNVIVAIPEPRGSQLADELEDEGLRVLATLDPQEIAAMPADAASPVWESLRQADALVVPAARGSLTAGVVGACDRHGVRVVALGDRAGERRAARSFGLADPLPSTAGAWQVAEAVLSDVVTGPPRDERRHGSVVAVWGPHGAPGRTTMSVELAVELARVCGHVALVDADTHAPAVAVALGVADEGPGFAAACRQAELGGLDAAELTRLSVPVGGAAGIVDVLPGLNRAGRWPELSERRVGAALDACRSWADVTVVDVAASLETDEEIVSDLDGPRRNAASLASLREADAVVAVSGADPVSIARFLRGYAELRALTGTTPVTVVVNRLRMGPLGVDARGQIRRTLERFAGIVDVGFVPLDMRAADAALLQARPIGEVAARSALSQAVRRLAARVADAHGLRPDAAASGLRPPRAKAARRRGEEAGRSGVSA